MKSPFSLTATLLLSLVSTLMIAGDAETVVYWVGPSRVEAGVIGDRLAVHAGDAQAIERARGDGMVQHGRRDEAGRWRGEVRLPEIQDAVRRQQRADAVRQFPGIFAVRSLVNTGGGIGEVTERLAVRVRPGGDLVALAQGHGLRLVERTAYHPDIGILEVPLGAGLFAAIESANRLHDGGNVVFATPLIARAHLRRAGSDPLFASQWHLDNTGQWGGAAGCDINVLGAWTSVLGQNVNILVVDDGIQTNHPDLVDNARTDIDIDINYGDLDPAPVTTNPYDNHGTFVAGLAGARDNTIGVSGAAPRAGLVGVRLISDLTTDSQDAQAMNHLVSESVGANQADVSSNSWGPSDNGSALSPIGPLMEAALANGVANGRSGKGVVYVWAGGNGGTNDNSNYDGLANSRYVIAVGALNPDGTRASYSELGANLLVCAPGGGGGIGMVSTDRTGSVPGSSPTEYLGFATGNQDYMQTNDPEYSSAIGTSYATPLVSGVVALILQANPALTWRDVHHILVRSAVETDPGNGGWFTNGAVEGGHRFNHRYGFGLVDASAAVSLATSGWISAPAVATPLTISSSESTAIPDNSGVGIDRTLTISAPAAPNAATFRVERVALQVNLTHLRRGDLHFQLVSPAGTVSDIPRRPSDGGDHFSNWTFTSTACWGENPVGTWHVRVYDEAAGEVGTLGATTLTIHGYHSHPLPNLSAVSPTGIVAGSPDRIITCTGSGFVSGVSVVRWNGVDLASTVVSSTQMTAVVPSANLTTTASGTVTVANPNFELGGSKVSGGQTVEVSIAPTLTASATASTNEDTPVDIIVTVDDADDTEASLIVTATSADASKVANANLVVSTTGSPNQRRLTVTPAPDAYGSVVLSVAVSDGIGSSSQTITLTITSINNDPPIAFGGRFRAQPGLQISETVGGYDPDGTDVTFSATDPPGATFTFNTSTGAFAFTSQSGFRGMTSFTYRAHSGGQQTDWVPVFITVAGDPNGTRPLIVSEPTDEQIAVGANFTYNVQVDTRRYVIAPTLNYAIVGAPGDMVCNSTTGAISWTASGGDRHLSFGIVVNDTITGALDTQTIVLRVVAGGASN